MFEYNGFRKSYYLNLNKNVKSRMFSTFKKSELLHVEKLRSLKFFMSHLFFKSVNEIKYLFTQLL